MKIKLTRDLAWPQFEPSLHIAEGVILEVSQSRLGFYFGYLGEHVFIRKDYAEIIPDESQPAPVSALTAHLQVHRDTLLNNVAVAHHEGRTEDRDRGLAEAYEVISHLGLKQKPGFGDAIIQNWKRQIARDRRTILQFCKHNAPPVSPAPPVPDVGEGYRQVMPGEVIQEGDEYSGDGKTWHRRAYSIGDTFAPNHILTRRKVEQIYQYVLLAEGNVIQKGDQFWGGFEWLDYVGNIGLAVGQVSVSRRKVEPFCQYVLLTEGDVIREGDEFFRPGSSDAGGKWVPHSSSLGKSMDGNHYPIRRKVILDAAPPAAQTPGV